MEIKIIAEKENPLLKRREVAFQVGHDQTGSTPPRMETRRAVATALKANMDLVFIKKYVTKTGTRVAVGTAHVYGSLEQAKLVEPEYIAKRNVPPEKQEAKKE